MTARLTDFIRSNHPKRKAFVEQSNYHSRAYTYRDIEQGTRRIIAGLRSQSVKEGDRVILWGENSARWAMTFYACVFERVVVVPIDASFSLSFVNRVKEITEAKLVLCDQNSAEWNRLFENNMASHLPSEPPPGDSLLEIVFTSGSTGEPKGVMITHGNVLSNLLPIRSEYEKYKHYAIPFGTLSFVHLIPLSHLFGQIMGLFIPQMLNGTVVFSDPAAPQVVRAVKENRASAVICVPRQLSLLQNYYAARDRSDPTPVRYRGVAGIVSKWWKYRKIHREFGWKFWAFISGGAALAHETEKFWSDRGFAVIQGYGLTETAPSVTITHPFKGIEPGSVGKKLPGIEIKIADDGEILVRGPNVSPGYYRNQSASEALFEDGWLRTGDFGEFDENGNLRLRGRKKEVIISASGLNVYPEDVESILNRDPRVRESAVVGHDSGGRLLVHAVLLLNEGVSSEESEDIVAKANASLENFQQIQTHEVWSETHLPRTSTGKMKRVAIAAGMTADAIAESPTEKLLHEILAGSGEKQNRELGLSSLDRVELLVALESETGVSIDDTAFAQARTAEDIRKLIREPVAVSGAAGTYPSWRWPLWWPVKAFRILCWYLLVFPVMPRRIHVVSTGTENLLRLSPPFLFVANHQSIIDVPVILKALPRKFRHRLAPAMSARETGLRRFSGALFFNSYPLPQTSIGLKDALRHTGELTERGYCPLVFPEGARTTDGKLSPFRPGIGVIVKEMKLPVIPIELHGAFEIWPVTSRGPVSRGTVSVRFGHSIDFTGKSPAEITKELESLYRAGKDAGDS